MHRRRSIPSHLDASWTARPRARARTASTPTSTATPRARRGMTASEIRALFAVASPARGGLAGRRDAEHLRPAARRRRPRDRATWSRTHGAEAMQYGSGQGVPELREQITEVMRLEGIEAHPDDVVVTVGSQQAVDLVTRVFCDPGDVVICEAPSLRRRARGLQGLRVRRRARRDGRRRAGAGGAAAGDRRGSRRPARRIKFLYTIPNFHNPAGVTLSAPRRRRDPGHLPPRGRPHPRGQPLRPAGLRRRAAACAARRRGRGRDLPRLVLQDLRARVPGRLGAGAARGAREAGAGPGVRDAVPAAVLADGGLGVPLRRTTGRARSSSSARCTASGATRWSTRCTT